MGGKLKTVKINNFDDIKKKVKHTYNRFIYQDDFVDLDPFEPKRKYKEESI